MSLLETSIAVTRFGMGARLHEISNIGPDGRGWLLAQLEVPERAVLKNSTLKSSREIVGDYAEMIGKRRSMRRSSSADAKGKQKAMRKNLRRDFTSIFLDEIKARNTFAVETNHGFLERWVRFWSNHFSVSSNRFEMRGLVGAFEREAIRPNAFGAFSDLLGAATLHSAMLLYLENHRSVGPSTQVAKKRGLGLNENLAREVLELHTVGVDGGYSQEDVIEFAKALTGWTVKAPPIWQSDFGKVIFENSMHEPGRRTVLGKTYSESGGDQARSILKGLSCHASTARFVATKLARHFVSDEPPENAIAELEAAFLRSDGNLTELAKAVINLEQAWGREPQKFKTPEELLISTSRLVGANAVFGGLGDVRKIYTSLGQPPFGAPSPEGWPDIAKEWTGADAIKKRLEWANRTGQRSQSRLQPSMLLKEALGDIVSERTETLVSRAESNAQGLTLALMSPEFQRR